ncbi:DUF3307 domain-containing protein [Desulfoscipio gibsoniae]|uniref:DUF3307 domain-containing protein n=1 Tax=Desulfoscipio gibsoniae DSM 7213 TaxID=767817 RepID=R4KI15_9FIRM|nr:DUF3307 domain-containing protein [Desulfoscipio gibsoniae]AGL02254.1 Protein of unknown function (DUF3307) [Desulfoscipio gibsoniae DSM 7213]
MNLFAWLLVGHLVGDYLLQNRWMAEGKTTRWAPLLVHSTVYTLAVALPAVAAGGLSWRGILLVFLAHLVLDRRGFVHFWTERVTGSANVPWLVIMADQAWHILVLSLATLV